MPLVAPAAETTLSLPYTDSGRNIWELVAGADALDPNAPFAGHIGPVEYGTGLAKQGKRPAIVPPYEPMDARILA